MAKYDITHSCGHKQTHNIVGTNVNGERDRKQAWLADQPCTQCWRQAQAEQRAQKSAAAAEDNKGLPELTGSVKQVAWAETIRAQAAASLSPIKATMVANRANAPQKADLAINIIDATLANASAKWWIDNRDAGFDLRWLAIESKKAMGLA